MFHICGENGCVCNQYFKTYGKNNLCLLSRPTVEHWDDKKVKEWHCERWSIT